MKAFTSSFLMIVGIFSIDLATGQAAPIQNKTTTDDAYQYGLSLKQERLEAEVIGLIGEHHENGLKGSLNDIKDELFSANTIKKLDGKVTYGDILLEIANDRDNAQKEDEELEKLKVQFGEIAGSQLSQSERAFALSEFFKLVDSVQQAKVTELAKIGDAADLDGTDWATQLKNLVDGIEALEKLSSKSTHPFVNYAISHYKSLFAPFVYKKESIEKSHEDIEMIVEAGYKSLKNDIESLLRGNLSMDPDGSPNLHNLLRIAVYFKSESASREILRFASTETGSENANFVLALQNVNRLNSKVLDPESDDFSEYENVIELLKSIVDQQNHTVATQQKLLNNVVNEVVIKKGFAGLDKEEEGFDKTYRKIADLVNLIQSKFDSSLSDDIKAAKNNLIHLRYVGEIN